MDVSCGSPQASTRAEQCWQIDLTRKRKTRGDRRRRRRSVERMSWGDGGKEEGATCCKFKMHPSPSACLPRKETDGRGLKGGGGGISSPTQKCVHRGIAISQMNAFSSIHCLTYAKKPSNNESHLLLSKAAIAGARGYGDSRTRQHDSWNFTPAATAGRLSAAPTSRRRLIPAGERTLRRAAASHGKYQSGRHRRPSRTQKRIGPPRARSTASDAAPRRGGQSAGRRRNVQRVSARFARASRDC